MIDDIKRGRGRPALSEAEKSKMMRFRIKPDLLERLQTVANERSSNMSEIITQSLEAFISDVEKNRYYWTSCTNDADNV